MLTRLIIQANMPLYDDSFDSALHQNQHTMEYSTDGKYRSNILINTFINPDQGFFSNSAL